MRKMVFVFLAIVLAVSLAVAAVTVAPASADPGVLLWTDIPIPKNGSAGDYTLWSGSDVGPIVVSPDGGIIFAAALNGTSGNWSLMRSTDGGYGWKLMWTSTQAIVDIDVSDDWVDDDTVVVATANNTTSAVYISVDRGVNFSFWGTFTETVTSLDVSLDVDGYLVAVVGTYDGAGGGDVYLRTMITTWTAQGVGYDVLDVGIPTYATDEGIIAVVANATLTLARTKLSTNAWGVNIADTRFVDQNGANFGSTEGSLGFPDDYDTTPTAYGGKNVFFVGLTAGGLGDVFKVTSLPVGASPLAEDLDVRGIVGINPTETDIYSIAVSGNLTEAAIIAGTAKFDPTMTPTQYLVYHSANAGATWAYTLKQPTGGPTGANTYVAMGSPIAYAGTSGTESAFSVSTTDPVGMAWNQRGLIDTVINTINDIAASEGYATDNQFFMATQVGAAGTFSLWLTSNEGDTWERILCNSPVATLVFNSVQLVPGYPTVPMVFVAMKGSIAILRSHDGGTTFLTPLMARAAITAWKVTGATTVYTGHAGGAVWWTTNLAVWEKPEETEITGTVTDIAVGSDILVGDNAGKVYLSIDAGVTIDRVGTNAVGTGTTHVALDNEYDTNNMIYAGADSTNVYRFEVGTSTVWEKISPTGETILVSGLVSADDGTLYASDSTANAGAWRCVNPTRSMALGGPTFEAMTDGLPTGATLEGLEVVPGSNILFAIDTANVGLVTFTDTLTGWNYIFEDWGRGTELRINTADKTFQFIALGYDTGVKSDPDMKVRDTHSGQSVSIRYRDGEIRFHARAVDGERDYCRAFVTVLETRDKYRLVDPRGVE